MCTQIIDASKHLTYELCFIISYVVWMRKLKDTETPSKQVARIGTQEVWPRATKHMAFLLIFLPLNASELKTYFKIG